MTPQERLQAPYPIASDIWIIPQVVPSGPERFTCINSMVIAGTEAVVVDTGCAVYRDQWLEDLCSIVDPDDVRWVYLSHTDRDHIGNLPRVMELCKKAEVITTMAGVTYMSADGTPPFERMRWVNDGESYEANGRRLHAIRPPFWDATNTRGLFDPATGVYWSADCFASELQRPVTSAQQLDREFWIESFVREHRVHCEWHALLDRHKFERHLRRTEALHPSVIASAHGPVLTDDLVEESYRLIRDVIRMDPLPAPGESVLEQMVQAIASLSVADQAA